MQEVLLPIGQVLAVIFAIWLLSLIIPPERKKGIGFISRRVEVKHVLATIPGTPVAKVLQPGDEILDLQFDGDKARLTFRRGYGIAIVELPRVKYSLRLVREVYRRLG